MAVPLLLLVARDLLLYDPPRVLAWRLLHEARLSDLPRWLRALVPAGGSFDRDPLALLLGAACSGIALALLACGLAGVRARTRAILLALGAGCAVILPTVSLMAMGAAMERPYGQDGGVVQLPLALDLLLQGRSPYGADYSGSILGRQARVSPFWQAYGGNPLLRHHAYLPGTHLLMLPGYLLARAAGVAFDPRMVTLLALAAAAWLAAKLAGQARGHEGALAAAAIVLVNPLVYWPQAFGANDILQAALLLAAVALAGRGRALWCGAVLGLACASKQLAWPYAPFLIAHLSGARTLRELASPPALRRMSGPALAALAVFAAVVVPVLALDPRAFWGDIVVYNVGLPGALSYPLGGTPGFGFANFLIYFGRVASLRDHVSFAPFYAVLAPVCLLLLRRQLREPHAAAALVSGSAALLGSVYVSRVAHPNYLVLAAILLPIGLLVCSRRGEAPAPHRTRAWTAEAAVAPLLLLMLAVEFVEHEPLRAVWEDAVAARLPEHASAPWSLLLPRAGPHLTLDPLGLLFGAVAAGLAVAWLIAALLGASPRLRLALGAIAVAALVVAPAGVLASVGAASGVPRAQDPWFAAVSHEARKAAGQSDPAPAREAWSMSFRRDPPGPLADPDSGSPAQRALGRLLGRWGRTDPRPALALALAVAGAVLAWRARPEQRPLVLAFVALAPPAAMGVVMGSAAALALVVVAATLAVRERPLAAATAGGFGCALFPWLSCAVPFVFLRPADPTARRARAVAAFAAALLVAGASFMVLAGARTALPGLQPGIGLPNLLLYAGLDLPPWALWSAVVILPFCALARAWRGTGRGALAEGAVFLLAALWLMPAQSPDLVVVPMTLLLLGALAAPDARVSRDALVRLKEPCL